MTAAAGARALTVNVSGHTIANDIVDATATTVTYNTSGAASNVIGLTTHAAATTLNINAATAATFESLNGTAALSTVNIAGAGNVTISGAFDTDTTVVNGSTATGNITAIASTLVTATTTLGAGADNYTTGGVLTTGSVAGGAGTDILAIGANVAHANTTSLAAKYTGFEVLNTRGTFNAALFTDLTGYQIAGATNAITGMNAAAAANMTVLANAGATTIALATATGTTDVVTVAMGTGLAATAATTFGALTVTGFETANFSTNHGATATAGADRTATIASFIGATLATVNLTGSAFVITAADLSVASTINAADLAGDGATSSLGLTLGTAAYVGGSVINGSAFVDSVIIDAGTEGVTLNLGAGNDLVGNDLASLVNDGTDDMSINGGAGTDKITLSDTSATMTDNHFMNMTGLEALTVSTGVFSITTGSAFNTAFADGFTLTTGIIANTQTFTLAAGTATVNMTAALILANDAADASKDTLVTTGSGNDTITIVAASHVGDAASASIEVDTGAGTDSLTITGINMGAENAKNMVLVNMGTGKDAVVLATHDNGSADNALVEFVISGGDSTATAYDTISGFEVGDTTNYSSQLNFAGSATINDMTAHVDFGTIASHNIATAGIFTFDTAATFATVAIINASNIQDVVGYLDANATNTETAAFLFDSTGSGVADSTMVYNKHTTGGSLVELTGLTGVDILIVASGSGENDLFVL